MKVKFFSVLAVILLFAACENPFVMNILPDGNNSVPPGSFVVTFDRNGGDSDADPKTKVVSPPATTIDKLPAQPTWADHAFTGWNTKADGSGTVFSAATTVTADITVYAQWNDVPEGSFVVTFDKNGGDTDADPVSKVVTPPATTIDSLPTAPVREGYTFKDWNTQEDGSGDAFTASTEVTADITVYAQWEEVPDGSFVVTFNKNGGDTDADPVSIVVIPPATTIDSLPAPPVWTNYTFAGWNTQADGTGTAFTASTVVSADITVYAQWTPLSSGPTTVNVDFENDSLGYVYNTLSGAVSQVVADPANAGQKALQITSNNYNQAAVIPINLPRPLSEAESLTFRFNLTNGTISYKRILVYISDNAATFVDGGFGNPANSQYPQFAANKLGETDEIPELTLNQWSNYTINISGLNSAIRDLTGDVYLAIGINHSDSEGITYLLDDLTFTFGTPQPPPEPGAPVKVDFENDAIEKAYGFTQGNNSPTSVKVVADPVNTGQKSLEFTGTTGYNQAAVIPINLPAALNTYRSFTFRFNMKTGTLENKDMAVYVASSADTFVRYGFGNPSTENNHFAANLLGSVRLTDVKNQWDTYAIAIESPGSAISNLSGNVFIAIGINHNDGIVYYLDDLTFSSDEPPPPPASPTLVTFEEDAIGKTYGYTRGDNSPEVTVRADPASLALSTKSLRIVTNGGSNATSGYNQAVIIPINLPDGNLSEYRSFRFKFYYTGGALLDPQNQPRKINAYVSDSTGTFIQYGFGNPSGNQYQFAANLLGEVEPDYGETQWMDYAINFTAGSAISGLSGNVYVAVGINHDRAVTYYLDDLTFSKTEVTKTDGLALDGTLAVNTPTHNSVEITAGSVTVAGGVQTIEYAVAAGSSAPSGWQAGRTFTGLTPETAYTAYARSAANAQYNAGTSYKSVTFTTASPPPKPDGAALSGSITATVTHNRIIINVVAAPGNGQIVEYAVSTGTTAPASGWQTGTTFSGLQVSTTYYVFARSKENDNNKAGTPISASFTTEETPQAPPVPPTIVNFEDKTIGDTYNRVSGQGSSTAAVVSDPDTTNYPNEKSLQITSNNWNNGAIIPINLPFALKNYESFTFRYRLATSMPESNRGNGIWVYITDTPSSLTQNQLGNNNTSYTSKLLKNIVPDYGVTDQWVDHEIELMDSSGNSTVLSGIQELSGDIFLVIGINSQQNITYQLDDLTFNINYDFEPTPGINPATATYDLNASNVAQHKNIDITVSLYGSTLLSITNGATALTSGTHYTHVNGIVTLPISYLDTLTVGTTTLTFNFSGNTTKTFTITVRNTAGTQTDYDFTTNPSVTPEYAGTGTLVAQVTGGVLRVEKTNTNHTTPYLILPFNLGSTTLGSYSRIRFVIRGVSGDLNNKQFKADVSSDGTAYTSIGSVSTGGSGFGAAFANVDISIGASNLSGPIKIRIYLDNTQNFIYEIQSIRFE
jgi:uncharacterized repeat protein (TIGR02543 family)